MRALGDPGRAGCELNTRFSHLARERVLLSTPNRPPYGDSAISTLDDKDPCPRTCLKTRHTVYNAGARSPRRFASSRRVVPARAKTYYLTKYDSRSIRGEKVVTPEVAA